MGIVSDFPFNRYAKVVLLQLSMKVRTHLALERQVTREGPHTYICIIEKGTLLLLLLKG